MDVKFSLLVSTSIIIMFAIAAQCSVINQPEYDDNSENNYYWGVPVYTPSRECSSLGGLCVQENDCERGQLTQTSGLCEDRGIGVECCYKVVPREAPCNQFGGACMSNCTTVLRQSLANDCGDQFCCILV